AMLDHLMSLGLTERLAAACRASTPAAAPTSRGSGPGLAGPAEALSELQQAAAGFLVHVATSAAANDVAAAGRCLLDHAAVLLVLLLRRAIAGSKPPCREAPGAAEAAGAGAGAATDPTTVDAALLEAALRGLARLSAEPRGGAEACVRAKAVPWLLQALRVERSAYAALRRGHQQQQQQQQQKQQQQPQQQQGALSAAIDSITSGAVGHACYHQLEQRELERPLACLQARLASGGAWPAQPLTAADDACADGREGALALAALLNVSSLPAGQLAACRHGLYTLIRTALSCPDVGRAGMAAAVLRAVCGNAGNASAVYKAEMRLKRAALLRAAGLRPEERRGRREARCAGEDSGEAGAAERDAAPPAGQPKRPTPVPALAMPASIPAAPAAAPAAMAAGPRRASIAGAQPTSSRAGGAAASPRPTCTFEAAGDAALMTARWGVRGAEAARHVGPDTAQASMVLTRITPRLLVRADGARISKGAPGARDGSGGGGTGADGAAAQGASGIGGDGSGGGSGAGEDEDGEAQSIVYQMAKRISMIGSAACSPRIGASVVAAAPADVVADAAAPAAAPVAAAGLWVRGPGGARRSSVWPARAQQPEPDVRAAFLEWCDFLDGPGASNAGGAANAPTSRRPTLAFATATCGGGSGGGGAASDEEGEGDGDDLTTDDPEERAWLLLQRRAAEAERARAESAARAGALKGRFNRSLCRGRAEAWQGRAKAAAAAAGARAASAEPAARHGGGAGGRSGEGSGALSHRQGRAPQSKGGLLRARPQTAGPLGRAPPSHTKATPPGGNSVNQARPASAGAAAPWAPSLVGFVQSQDPVAPGPVRRRCAADRLMVAAAPGDVVDALAGG
ncbi:hypothetical protein MNEG_6699, partial [Monoraphidium neglectum]